MTIQRIKPGARMSGAVVHGDTVYLAGQVADKTAGGSVTEQTREILSIIDGLLSEAGTDKSKLLMTNIWLTDINILCEIMLRCCFATVQYWCSVILEYCLFILLQICDIVATVP